MKKTETIADRGQKKSSAFILENQRVSEICRLMRHRYGGPCRIDDGAIWLDAVIPTLAVIAGGIDAPAFAKRVASWAAEHVPIASQAEIAVAISEARTRNEDRRLMLKARELGDMLKVTSEERRTLRIRTIRQAGVSDREMKALKRAHDAERKRKSRQRAGAKPREQSLSQTEPWRALGMSRRAWERNQNPQPVAAGDANSSAIGGTPFSGYDANSSAIDLTSPSRTNLRHASTKLADASRADSSTRKRSRSNAASGKPANDNRRLKPWSPKRGRRMAIVGSVNDNGGAA